MTYHTITLKKKSFTIKATQEKTGGYYSHYYYVVVEDKNGNIINTSSVCDTKLERAITKEDIKNM